jgi:hypothetical protein
MAGRIAAQGLAYLTPAPAQRAADDAGAQAPSGGSVISGCRERLRLAGCMIVVACVAEPCS